MKILKTRIIPGERALMTMKKTFPAIPMEPHRYLQCQNDSYNMRFFALDMILETRVRAWPIGDSMDSSSEWESDCGSI